jgi:hypothetical protein
LKKIIQGIYIIFLFILFNYFFRKNGQYIFEIRRSRSSHNLIDIAQTLQLTKSKRIPVERQTTFEKPENQSSIEQIMQITSFENPNRLTVAVYNSPERRSTIKHYNSTRTSSKAHTYHSFSPRTIDQQTNPSDQ